AANRLGPQALWRHGIPSDRPIILARIAEVPELTLVRQLLVAHEFLRLKGLNATLVVLDEGQSEEDDDLSDQLRTLVQEEASPAQLGQHGGVFVLEREERSEDDVILLEAVARVVLDGARGTLAGQLDRTEWVRTMPETLTPSQAYDHWDDEPIQRPSELQYFNGLGGFTSDGREYCFLIDSQATGSEPSNGRPVHRVDTHPHLPPAPWVN